MKISDFNLKDILRILLWYLAWTGMFWGFGFYALSKIIIGQGLETFRLGNLPVPSFIHSSNIEVSIFCATAIVAVAVGFYVRYIKYGEELHFKRKFNIKDDRSFADEVSDFSGGGGDGGSGD